MSSAIKANVEFSGYDGSVPMHDCDKIILFDEQNALSVVDIAPKDIARYVPLGDIEPLHGVVKGAKCFILHDIAGSDFAASDADSDADISETSDTGIGGKQRLYLTVIYEPSHFLSHRLILFGSLTLVLQEMSLGNLHGGKLYLETLACPLARLRPTLSDRYSRLAFPYAAYK